MEEGDIMAIAEGIAAARLALDAGKAAIDLVRYPDIDGEKVRAKLIEMQDLIVSAQHALGDADLENRQLRRTVEELEARIKSREELIPADEAYFKRNKNGALDGPFCTICSDSEEKLVRMKFTSTEKDPERGLLKLYTCLRHPAYAVKLPAANFTNDRI